MTPLHRYGLISKVIFHKQQFSVVWFFSPISFVVFVCLCTSSLQIFFSWIILSKCLHLVLWDCLALYVFLILQYFIGCIYFVILLLSILYGYYFFSICFHIHIHLLPVPYSCVMLGIQCCIRFCYVFTIIFICFALVPVPRKSGKPLLSKLSERVPESLDYLSVSYGLTLPLMKFWCRASYIPLYIR